jgi:hypothetical protein
MLVYQAMGWMNPANIANAKGEKAVANFDEDSITMAVAAGLNAINGMERSNNDQIYKPYTLPLRRCPIKKGSMRVSYRRRWA